MQWTLAIRAAALAGAALVPGTMAPAQPAAAAAGQALDYDLPAQDLGDMLRAIARKSGQEILFEAETVRGFRSPAVSGHYSFEQAIRAALGGSDTLAVEYRDGAALIRQRPGDAGPEPRLPDAGGAITVTGSRIRGAGSASPVTVATRRELERSGIADLAEFTRILPQNYTGGQTRGIAGGGEHGGQQNLNNSATLNLRGLGPDATLTLLNGRRLAYDSVNQGIDISAIPLSAIERIEVVSDGASALYGSDAVGGVANIILRRDYQGVETTVRLGGSLDGGNAQRQVSLVAGHRWGGGGLMVALDGSSASPIYAGQRGYARSVDPSLTLTDGNRQFSAVVTAHQEIGPGLAIDFDGHVMDRRARLQNPFTPTADARVIGLVSRPHVRSHALTPTLRADLGRWQGSLSVTEANSRTLLDTKNYFNSVPRHLHLLYENSLRGAEATAEGPLFTLPGGEARVALGGGIRRVALHVRYLDLTGGQRTVTRNLVEGRSVQFAYGELSLPLAGPELGLPLIERLTLSAALRHEHWNGIAAVTTPKLGLVYQPSADATIRATWGKSFKIPTLLQVNQVEEGDLIPGFYFDPGPQPAGAPVLLLTGSKSGLRPERATTWSGTVELTPRAIPGLRLQATYFHVDYGDRIASPLTNVLSALHNPVYDDFIVYNPSAAEVTALLATLPGGLVNQTGEPFDPGGVGAIVDLSLRNIQRQRVQGVDLSGDYRIDLQGGRLLLTAAASYLESKQRLAPGQPVFQLAGRVFHPPHWRGRGGASWEADRGGLSAFVNYVGATIDDRFSVVTRTRPFVTLDLNASLRSGAGSDPFDNIELRLSALNVLDQKPHFIRNSFANAAPYDSTNESPVGRFLAASVRKVW